MSDIYLVRHGQASFSAEDYDELSDKGWQQARVLGEALRGRIQPDVVISGGMKRHRQTHDGFAEAFGALPQRIEEPAFNEFDHVDVLVRYQPEWADRSKMLAFLQRQPVPMQAFQEAFSEAIKRWIGGDFDDDYNESWPVFRSRCEAGLQSIVEQTGSGKTVLVFTSGGPISVICGRVLSLGLREIFSVNQNLANAGVTRLLFSGRRLSLSYLNNFSDMECCDPALVTYR